jgi:hypothetical protein
VIDLHGFAKELPRGIVVDLRGGLKGLQGELARHLDDPMKLLALRRAESVRLTLEQNLGELHTVGRALRATTEGYDAGGWLLVFCANPWDSVAVEQHPGQSRSSCSVAACHGFSVALHCCGLSGP